MASLDEDVWMVPEADVRRGDRAVIWKAKGNGDSRGVVAFSEVLSDPATMEEPEPSRPFWREQRPPATRRVRVRYVRPVGVPVWFDGHQPPALDALTVSRGQGSGPYIVSADQWRALLDLVGGWTESPDDETGPQREIANAIDRETARRRGQGFSTDPEFNSAVEQRGMDVAKQHFGGWSIEDTSANCPYDLIVSRGAQRWYVEVKGTTGGAEAVTVTYNEVEHARRHPGECILIVVHGISVGRGADGRVAGTGGRASVIDRWCPSATDLKPLAYRFTIPQERGSEPQEG